MKFWPLNPYYKRSDIKTWLSARFSEALTSKLWNEKKRHAAECYRNGAKLNYVKPPMVLSKFFNDLSMRNSGEKIKSGIPCEQMHGLIGWKRQNSFH